MANIQTRIKNKHDTEANWNSATNFTPLDGEIIVYDVDSNHPYPRYKVGDGTTLVDNLPFSTDVLDDYLKQVEPNTYQRLGNVAYNVCNCCYYTNTKEIVIYTSIRFLSSIYMPVIHLYGYAYGLQSPIELKIGFYIYADKLGYCGVTNMGAWAPDVYLFKYTKDETDYVAVGLKGIIYFPQFSNHPPNCRRIFFTLSRNIIKHLSTSPQFSVVKSFRFYFCQCRTVDLIRKRSE